ncbi:MAG: hypothetical protein ABFD64_09485 [Armatimonadota bacterium]
MILDQSVGWEGIYPVEPAFIPVVQLNYLTGRAVPVAAGPLKHLESPDDAALDHPLHDQAGIELILRVLRESSEPVYVSVVGSARPLAAAYNRDPDMVRKKVRAILLNAGSTGSFFEWNVEIDPMAYICLFKSGMTIYWYPCATENGPFDSDNHNTFWRTSHRTIFKDLPLPMRAWFTHSYSGNMRGDIIRALHEQGNWSPWDNIFSAPARNLWSTASLITAANRALVKTGEGWRFVSKSEATTDAARQRLGLKPVNVTIDEGAITSWTPSEGGSNVMLYGRDHGPEHTEAMAEALNALLCSIHAEL